MGKVIRVGMADLNVCKAPDKITTVGLGSCVGVVIYDEQKKIGGMLHAMLPDSTRIRNNTNTAKFADTGIVELVNKLVAMGAEKKNLKAKLAGGAKMFDYKQDSGLGGIGNQNVLATIQQLAEIGIPIIAQDTGENYGRTIIFNPDTAILTVNSVGMNSEDI